MRAKGITGMIAVGSGAYVRPEEIAAFSPYCGPVPSGGIDATGGKAARTVILLRSGAAVYSSLTIRVLVRRLGGEEKENPARGRVGGIVAQQPLFGDHPVDEGE